MTNDINSTADNKVEQFDLDRGIDWIKRNGFSKICLQFPESLLYDSVDIATYIERQSGKSVFILGDTAYGSCCVDAVACHHVDADGIIHFGHSCLSPVTALPVLYIFPKKKFNSSVFVQSLKKQNLPQPCLILYDVAYEHSSGELYRELGDSSGICLSSLEYHSEEDFRRCSEWCSGPPHTHERYRRTFCIPSDSDFQSIVYIASENCPNLSNFVVYYRGAKFVRYSHEDGFVNVPKADIMLRTSYLVEKVKDANNIGIVVMTLGIGGFREAIDHAKQLCKNASKRSYIISVGKPNPEKLANFPEIDVFVSISCPESDYGDRHLYLQPIIGLFELDLGLNESRKWSNAYSRDFRDIIEGGADFVELGSDVPQDKYGFKQNVSLITNKVQDINLDIYREKDSHIGDKDLRSVCNDQEKDQESTVEPFQEDQSTVAIESMDNKSIDNNKIVDDKKSVINEIDKNSIYQTFESSRINSNTSIQPKVLAQLVKPNEAQRTWKGLDPRRGQDDSSVVTKGKSGTPSSYESETTNKNNP